MRAFTPKGWTRPILTSTNKNLKRWRAGLSVLAQKAIFDLPGAHPFPVPADVPLRVHIIFGFVSPKSRKDGSIFKTTRPDLDKLIRSTLDAMTGIVYKDDSQVAQVQAMKVFADRDHVRVSVENATESF
jgi:crossover junction endodeoxyribonuclease RusA